VFTSAASIEFSWLLLAAFLAMLRVVTFGVTLAGAGIEAVASSLSSCKLSRLSSRLLLDQFCGLVTLGVATVSYCSCCSCCLLRGCDPGVEAGCWGEAMSSGASITRVFMPFITVYRAPFSCVKPWLGDNSTYAITGSGVPCCCCNLSASAASLLCLFCDSPVINVSEAVSCLPAGIGVLYSGWFAPCAGPI
jgi:hypothetical protein